MSWIPQYRVQSNDMLLLFKIDDPLVFKLSIPLLIPFDVFWVRSFEWFWCMNCMWIWECGQSLFQRLWWEPLPLYLGCRGYSVIENNVLYLFARNKSRFPWLSLVSGLWPRKSLIFARISKCYQMLIFLF